MNKAFRSKSFKHKLVMLSILDYVNEKLPGNLKARRINRVHKVQRNKKQVIHIDTRK